MGTIKKRIDMIIQEDYVSFEIAKLLKEKGFNEPCYACYLNKELSHYDYTSTNFELIEDIISAPTLQMAMKWLREMHNWNIFINKSNTIYGYDANIESLVANHIVEVGCEKTYEKACEAAIKYCLENLI